MTKTAIRPTTMKTQIVIGKRPNNVPSDWVICNAPRYLAGEMDFIGDFVRGVHYAAFSPESTRAEYFISENENLQAWILQYVERDWALSQARQTISEVERISLEEAEKIDSDTAIQWYLEHLWDLQHSK